MLATLLESRRTVSWPLGNGVLSLAAHAGVVTLSIVVTALPPTGGPALNEATHRVPESIRYVTAAGAPAGAGGGARPAIRRPTRRPVALATIPAGIPEIPDLSELNFAALVDALVAGERDLAHLVSRPDDFVTMEPAGAFARRRGALALRAPGSTYHAGEVERMAVPFADNPHPRYPAVLLGSRIEGDVIVQFVVDSTGAADPSSLRVMRSTHELFTRAVKSVVPKLRFMPAEVAGIRVQVLVEQPFRFSVR